MNLNVMQAFCPQRPRARPTWGGAVEAGRRLTTILPAMRLAEGLNTTRLHRVAGRTGGHTAFATTRPCHALPHTISDVGWIGGGQVPMPGEVSLAHHGFLFLDELPEFRRHVLEVLRQPLEKSITYTQSPARHRRLCVDRVRGAGKAFASRSHPARG